MRMVKVKVGQLWAFLPVFDAIRPLDGGVFEDEE